MKISKLFMKSFCICLLATVETMNSSDQSESHENVLSFTDPHYNEIEMSQLLDFPNTTKLIITNTNITAFPAGIENLPHLIYIECRNNKKLNNFDNLFNASESVKKQITTIILNNNKMNSVPNYIGDFVNLEILSLKGNSLKTLPNSLSNLNKLVDFSVANNRLEKLPETINGLVCLQKITLSNNDLKTLPIEFAYLQNLEYINLDNNKFESLPMELFLLHRLDHLSIRNNELYRIFPSEVEITQYKLAYPVNVHLPFDILEISKKLILYKNFCFYRLFPREIINFTLSKTESQIVLEHICKFNTLFSHSLTSLSELNISGNRITEIPEQIKTLKRLCYLKAKYNLISRVPRILFELENLIFLNLDYNLLEYIPYFNDINREDKLSCGLSHNCIGMNDVSGKGYGQVSLLRLRFQSLNLSFQRKLTKSYEDVLNKHYEEQPHWNLDQIKKPQCIDDIKEKVKNISDNTMKKMWFKVIQYFLYENSDLSVDPQTPEDEITEPKITEYDNIIFRIKRSGVLEQLKTSSTTHKKAKHFVRQNISDWLLSISNDINETNIQNSDGSTVNSKLKNHIKIIFLELLINIEKAQFDSTDLDTIAVAVTDLCENIFTKCITGQMTGLKHYYYTYCMKNETLNDEITIFIQSKIDDEKENAFLNATVKNAGGNVHILYEWRLVFKNLLGLVVDFDDPHRLGRNEIDIHKMGNILHKFFEVFSVPKVINSLLEEINKNQSLINKALEVLINIVKKENTNAIQFESKYDELVSLYDYTISVYFEYLTNVEYEIKTPVKLKYEGLEKICENMQLIEDNKKQ